MYELTLMLRQELQPAPTRRWLSTHRAYHPTGDGVFVQGYVDGTPEHTSPYYNVSIHYPKLIVEIVRDALTTILSTHFQYPLAYQQKLQREQHLRVFKIILGDLTDLYYLQTLDTDFARLAIDPFPFEEDGGTHS